METKLFSEHFLLHTQKFQDLIKQNNYLPCIKSDGVQMRNTVFITYIYIQEQLTFQMSSSQDLNVIYVNVLEKSL